MILGHSGMSGKVVVHIRTLKQASNHELALKKVHRIIKSSQNINTKLRTEAKNKFEKDLFMLRNNLIFGKTIKSIKKHSNIRLATKDKRISYLVSERNYHKTKWCSENLLAIEMGKVRINIDKSIYLGLSIQEISKTVYELRFYYIKPEMVIKQ